MAGYVYTYLTSIQFPRNFFFKELAHLNVNLFFLHLFLYSVDPAEGGIAIPTGRHASWPSVPETENIRPKGVHEGNEGGERGEEDVNAENGSTAAAATGFAIVVLLLLILTAGIGLNICRYILNTTVLFSFLRSSQLYTTPFRCYR